MTELRVLAVRSIPIRSLHRGLFDACYRTLIYGRFELCQNQVFMV